MERTKIPIEFQQFWFSKEELENTSKATPINKEGITKEWNEFLLAVQARVKNDFPEID